MSKHEVRGVGADTRVYCPKNDKSWGPHPDAVGEMPICPYCGDESVSAGHDQAQILGEVFCPNTTMSTYRYCPGCGAEVATDD